MKSEGRTIRVARHDFCKSPVLNTERCANVDECCVATSRVPDVPGHSFIVCNSNLWVAVAINESEINCAISGDPNRSIAFTWASVRDGSNRPRDAIFGRDRHALSAVAAPVRQICRAVLR